MKKKKSYMVDCLEKLRAYWIMRCPDCDEKLYPIGLSMNPFWCDKCKKGWDLIIKESKYTKKDFENTIGFPKQEQSSGELTK